MLHAIDRSTLPTEGAESLIQVDVEARIVTRRVLLPPGRRDVVRFDGPVRKPQPIGVELRS